MARIIKMEELALRLLVFTGLILLCPIALSDQYTENKQEARGPNLCIKYIYGINEILKNDASTAVLYPDKVSATLKAQLERNLKSITERYDNCLYSQTPVPGTENYYKVSGYLAVFVLKLGLPTTDLQATIENAIKYDYQVLIDLTNEIIEADEVK